ncbi:hypothetical protein BRAS3843_1730014 [Bradyrhizobium sp. STM 3843]|uniref:toprim domain-containing protein n=1 Tax=Bradyrhizobium sp. STM 3843 TaxID=551947 RepID=UPI000240711F|nr:toprim domain-containing protein [Bradyrhizobium sp. STM 3843]CCE06445.1 hypothetical protein BRAS3843_1730014 [Bradyrhizobium sp. STM 3843]
MSSSPPSRSAAEILHGYNIATESSAIGRYYATCPRCSHKRKKAHQKLKCLGITIDHEGVQFGCNHCDWTGGHFYRESGAYRSTLVDSAKIEEVKRRKQEEADDRLKVALSLWRRRLPSDPIVERYLAVRGYTGPIPATIGFLPAAGRHPPAMIAAFGMARESAPGVIVIDDSEVRGVHLTKLKPDGSGKAGTENDKIMIGSSSGYPIVLAPVNDLLGLSIAEGIEDALSLHQATGLGAWAAGSANRLPALAERIPSYVEIVSIAADNDDVGLRYANELGRIVLRSRECRILVPA